MRRSRGREVSERAEPGQRLPLSIRHPRRVLVVAFVLLLTLGVIGINVNEKLSPTSLDVGGTPSSHANQMLSEHFGPSAPFAILLRGPAAAIDREGPELIRTLRRDPAVTTLSPWDRGSVTRLRPSPDHALILVDFHVGITQAVNEVVPRLDRILEQDVKPPVHATQSGFATLSRAIQQESINASESAELIAIPVLLLVLLLVFRSPVAAAIPLGFGAITVAASRGVLYFLTSWLSIDAFALTVCTMMGLALGVDYALLMVSRFREELEAGKEPIEAAKTTRATAGRTTVFAGSTLMMSMIVSIFILPGALLASLAGTVAMVVVLSVTVATVVGPALLTLIGHNINSWRIGSAPSAGRSRLMVVVSGALRRPVLATLMIGGVVLLLAVPAVGLKLGPPSPEQLSHSDPARKDAELINKVIGPGWDAPFVVVASTRQGPITDPARLSALTHFQRHLADTPGVQAVVGPGQISKRVEPLRESGANVLASDGNIRPVNKLRKLGRNLGVAAGGVRQLRAGISEASAGAGLLAEGSGRATTGAQKISSGLATASSGSERAVNALNKFASGTKRLSKALEEAKTGALSLKLGVHDLIPNLRANALPRSKKQKKSLSEDANVKLPQLIAPAQVAEAQVKSALQQLQQMTVGQSDAHYAPAVAAVRQALAALSGTDPVTGQPYAAGYAGLPAELTALQARLLADFEEAKQITAQLYASISETKRQARTAKQLSDGLTKIYAASVKLSNGAARLANASSSLNSGLARLGTGATALAGGLSRLGGGATSLEQNLADGFRRAYPLQTGLRKATVQVLSSHESLVHRIRGVHRSSPGLFNSGYFVLSALEGAPKRQREAASTAIDLKHGGQAASMLVISKYSFNSPGSISLNKQLIEDADGLGREAGLSTGIAGGAAQLNDYSRVTKAAIPYVVMAITIVTFLLLVAIVRAIPLAAIAVGLNLVSVAVAFGVLTLLFNVPADLPLGGHTYVEAVGAVMIFGLLFGLSIDYAVFLLTRMRERYDRDGDNAAAIEFGLDKTARVITGAAAIMLAVFIVFAATPIATVSQLGIGLTVAVFLDATVIRIVLLPALMLLIGDKVWWLPRSLERILPRLNV